MLSFYVKDLDAKLYQIPYRVLKYPIIIESLHNLFQVVFDTSIIPSVWRKAIMCPILKYYSTDPRVPMNYRGVRLLSCINKLYIAFINKRCFCYLEDSNLLADEQNRFRRNRSCEDHVFTLNSLIRNNDSLFVAFIDLKKCFDFIDRHMMLYTLLLNNIDGKIYNSISSIYQNSEFCVPLNGKLTDWFICEPGVKQGDNLYPTLFAVFINDLVKEVNDQDMGINIVDKKLLILVYADDIAMVANNEEDLQHLLNKLHCWWKKWRVLINTDKSNCMHFRRGRSKQIEFEFTVGRNVCEIVEQYTYLGVTFNCKGNFTPNANTLGKAAGRTLGKIISKIHILKDFGFKSYEALYFSCFYIGLFVGCVGLQKISSFRQYSKQSNEILSRCAPFCPASRNIWRYGMDS